MTVSEAMLIRYLASDCSADEIQRIRQWIARDPKHLERVNELRILWAAERPLPAWNVEGTWARLQRTTGLDGDKLIPLPVSVMTPLPTSARMRRWAGKGIAVMLGLAATIVLAVGVLLSRGTGGPWSSLLHSSNEREYATTRGQRAALQLPDGTRLVLAPESRVRIPATFGMEAREITLEGEAMFDVVHDAARPFRVRAKHAIAEDLGTRFSVRAYAEDSVVAVAVAEGVVALGTASDSGDRLTHGVAQGVLLHAGEFGALGPAGTVTTARGPQVIDYLRWADGKLVVAALPLREVVTKLNRWYGVDIRLATPALGSRRVTATFSDDSAATAVEFLASFLGLSATRSGDRYTLRAD